MSQQRPLSAQAPDVLLLDQLCTDAVKWLQERYAVALRSDIVPSEPQQLWADPVLSDARALVAPTGMKVTRDFLARMPRLEVLGRLTGGSGEIDLPACQDAGVAVLNTSRASVHSQVEYLVAALLSLQRPQLWPGFEGLSLRGGVMTEAAVPNVQGSAVGRELYRSVVGVLGLGPAAIAMAPILQALGVRMVGYDPAVHSSADIWKKLNIYPLPLAGVLAAADSVCVHIIYATRFQHFINEHVLKHTKRGQVWVCSGRTALFEPSALQAALADGRIKACLLDNVDPGNLGFGSELLAMPNLFLTPRVGANTLQAFDKASWYLAHRIDAALQGNNALHPPVDSMPTMPQPLEPATDSHIEALTAGR